MRIFPNFPSNLKCLKCWSKLFIYQLPPSICSKISVAVSFKYLQCGGQWLQLTHLVLHPNLFVTTFCCYFPIQDIRTASICLQVLNYDLVIHDAIVLLGINWFWQIKFLWWCKENIWVLYFKGQFWP